ncbi:MAG: hypothetical protein Q7J31_05630 [Syntrophales bacterium]|nr:hypothetical protein [Syntrophales bacterium]
MPEIVPLARHHDRSRFDCGVPELNSFLKATARQHGDKGISRTPENTRERAMAAFCSRKQSTGRS